MTGKAGGSLLELLNRHEEGLPLNGVRVVDLTRVWAGPLATRQLADMGAEVIRVEHRDSRGPAEVPPDSGLRLGIFPGGEWRPDPWNRQAAFNKLNRNKLSVCLDVGKPEGKAVLRDLLAVSDVVIENFSSRVMPNWGLGWETLHELNPRLVYLSMPGFGGSGPYRDFVANGAVIEPHSGLSAFMAYEPEQPYRTQATFSDPLVGVVAAWAAVAALLKREQSGEGCHIDLAHTETTTRVIGAEIIAAQGGGWTPTFANRNEVFVPQGVYRCQGDDEWLALSVTNDAAWRALCELLGRSDWKGLDRDARRSLHDEIDAAITAWASSREKVQAMDLLQAAGIAAGAVLKNCDMVDAGILADSFFVDIEESWGETVPYPAFPVGISGASRRQWWRSPRLGEHNDLVLTRLLGRTEDDVAALYQAGVLASEPSA